MGERKVKILLAEDNLGDARLIAILMEESCRPIELVHVHNGEEALSYLKKGDNGGNPDVILLDLKMPRLDGLGFLKERLKDKTIASIPVIVLTGSDAQADHQDAMRFGANLYLLKPGNITEADTLWPTIERFISQKVASA